MRNFVSGLATLFCCTFVLGQAPEKATEPADVGEMPTTEAVNVFIKEGWEKAGITKPADKATDHEFLRRVFIDLIGRIATPEEVTDFEQDRSRDKRSKLVNRLMYTSDYKPRVNGQYVKLDANKVLSYDYTEEFAEHWANMWTTWLMTRSGHPVYREQIQAWLANKFANNAPYTEIVEELLTATGNTQKNGAVNFIVHHLGDPTPADRRTELGNHDAVPITSRVTKLFLGLQTQCTQCHDHPFNREWVQSDFWGVNAFFRQTRRSATPTPRPMGRNNNNQMGVAQIDLTDEADLNPAGRVYFERRDGKMLATKSVFLKDYAQAERGEISMKRLPLSGSKSRRQVLSDYVIGHDNFAKAYVNRIWGHLFGRGLHAEPSIDDFGSHNEVVHPELMERLAQDFGRYKYDTKMLLEWICNSEAYNLSHVAYKDNADQKFDPFFARMPLKAMSPEVLFSALSVATQSEAGAGDKAQRDRLRDQWMSKLVQNFGDDEGNELSFNGTIVQALLMLNGRELNSEIGRKGGVVDKIMLKSARLKTKPVAYFEAVIDDLFVTALNRHPNRAELAALKEVMIKGGTLTDDDPKPKPGVRQPKKGPSEPVIGVGGSYVYDEKFYQDVFWALLNTNEFLLNH